MVPQNNEKVSLENKEQTKEIVSLSENKEKFYNRIKEDIKVSNDMKKNILSILKNKELDDDKFDAFLWSDTELYWFIVDWTEIKNINISINNFLEYVNDIIKKDEKIIDDTKNKEKVVNIKNDEKNDVEEKNKETETKVVETETKVVESKNKTKDFFEKSKNKYKEIFWENSEFFKIFNENIDDDEKLKTKLFEFLSKKENRKEIFDKLAATWDKELYESTYQSLANLSPEIRNAISDFPETIYKVEIVTDRKKDIEIISQFPNAKEWEITKRWDIVSFGDKTIDLRDKKAYISGENGYKLETSISLPDTLDLKAEYLARKLEIREVINTDKRILELLGNKKKIKEKIDELEKQKKWGLWEDTGINIAINLLRKELEQIQAKLAVAVPNYRENQDDLLTSFLEKSIKENEEKLNKLEEKYRKDLFNLYENTGNKVRKNDEKTRETTRFLDLIWFSSLPQEITDKIINNIINTSKRNESQISELWFVANLKPGKSDFLWLNWLVWEDIVKQKKAFVKMFNKMITWETEKPIPTSDNDLLNQEKEISNKYKQEINGILFKEPFEWTWKHWIMEANLFKTNKKETPQTQN